MASACDTCKRDYGMRHDRESKKTVPLRSPFNLQQSRLFSLFSSLCLHPPARSARSLPQKASLQRPPLRTMARTRGSHATSASTGTAAVRTAAPAPAPPAAPVPQCDWERTAFTTRDEGKLRRAGVVADVDGNIVIPGTESRPTPPAGYAVMFMAFLFRGLSLPAHEFLRGLLFTYGV